MRSRRFLSPSALLQIKGHDRGGMNLGWAKTREQRRSCPGLHETDLRIQLLDGLRSLTTYTALR